MFFFLSKILAFLLKPILWIFILLTLSLLFKKRRKKLLLITFITFYFFTNNFISDTFSKIWEVPRFSPESTYDVGIVLGGISNFDKTTKSHNFNKYADRLMEAEQLYHKGIIRKIMVSGGNGSLFNNEYIEANAMKDYLIENNIPLEHIIIENTSRNTQENALNSSRILKKIYKNGDFLLITSSSHMRRSLLCFDNVNLAVTAFPTDCISSNQHLSLEYYLLPSLQAMTQWETLIKEWIGCIVYSVIY